jgi:hypothetical protein
MHCRAFRRLSHFRDWSSGPWRLGEGAGRLCGSQKPLVIGGVVSCWPLQAIFCETKSFRGALHKDVANVH